MSTSSYRNKLSALLTLMVMLTLGGCAKEEGFAPCSKQGQENLGDAKSGDANGTLLEFEDGRSKPRTTRGTSDGSSISDDGDDVGDGERNRKKKPTS
jgi:hypothetical protein